MLQKNNKTAAQGGPCPARTKGGKGEKGYNPPMIRSVLEENPSQRWASGFLVLALHLGLFYLLINGLKPHWQAHTPTRTVEVALLEAPSPPVVKATRPNPPVQQATPPKPVMPKPSPPLPSPAPAPEPVHAPVPPPTQVPASPPPTMPAPNPVPAQKPSTLPTPRKAHAGINPIYIPPLEELQRRYPREARREGSSGRVVVRLTVSPDGLVTDAVVRHADPPGLFDQVALDFVKQFRFEKGPAPFYVDQAIDFKLN